MNTPGWSIVPKILIMRNHKRSVYFSYPYTFEFRLDISFLIKEPNFKQYEPNKLQKPHI